MLAKSFVQTFNGVANLQMSFHRLSTNHKVIFVQFSLMSVIIVPLVSTEKQITNLNFPTTYSKIVEEVFVCNAFRKL